MKLNTLTRSPLRLTLALAGILAVSAGIGVASGAIPSSSGTIYTCSTNTDGHLRVIDKAKHQNCKAAEHALSWNEKARPAPPGREVPRASPARQASGDPKATKASQEAPAHSRSSSQTATAPAEPAPSRRRRTFSPHTE